MTLISIPRKPSKNSKCGFPDCPNTKKSPNKYCVPHLMQLRSGKIEEKDLPGLDLQRMELVAKGKFAEFIRLRDRTKVDIHSGEHFKIGDVIQASHIYNCDKYPGLQFDERNCFAATKFNNDTWMENDAMRESTYIRVQERVTQFEWRLICAQAESQFYQNYKYSHSELLETYYMYKKKIEELK